MSSYQYQAALRRYRRQVRRMRPGRRVSTGELAAGAGLVLVFAAGTVGATHSHHHGGHVEYGAPVPPGSAPASIAYSRTAWAKAFLAAIPEPVTGANVCAVVAWEVREGGGFGNQAVDNPLNVNPGAGAPWPGYNATGAWAFPDARMGLAYTVQTIRNGYYPAVLAALHRGNDPQGVWSAIEASPWAASHYDGTLSGNC